MGFARLVDVIPESIAAKQSARVTSFQLWSKLLTIKSKGTCLDLCRLEILAGRLLIRVGPYT